MENKEEVKQPGNNLSNELFDIAVSTSLTTAENRPAFDAFEKAMITHVYERLGLKDVPDTYKTFTQFLDAFAQTLMNNVQKDVELLNVRRRLAMIGLANTIQGDKTKGVAQKVETAAKETEVDTGIKAEETAPETAPETK